MHFCGLNSKDRMRPVKLPPVSMKAHISPARNKVINKKQGHEYTNRTTEYWSHIPMVLVTRWEVTFREEIENARSPANQDIPQIGFRSVARIKGTSMRRDGQKDITNP